MDGEERIRPIVFAGKKLPQLEFFQLMNETRLFGREFLFRLRALRWICFFRGELPQRFEIFHRALEFTQRIQERAHARNFLDIPLSSLAIRPEIGSAHSILERGQLAF